MIPTCMYLAPPGPRRPPAVLFRTCALPCQSSQSAGRCGLWDTYRTVPLGEDVVHTFCNISLSLTARYLVYGLGSVEELMSTVLYSTLLTLP